MTVVDGWQMVATDGSARPNPGPCGWAWAADTDRWEAGPLPVRADNNAAEIAAAIRLLQVTSASVPLWIVTDSRIVERLIAGGAAEVLARGGRTRDGRAHPYAGQVRELCSALHGRATDGGRLRVQWASAHTLTSVSVQHWLNRVADDLAGQASRAAARGARTHRGPGWGPDTSSRQGVSRGAAGAR